MLPEQNQSMMAKPVMRQQNPFQEKISAAVVARDLVRMFGQKVAVNHLNLTVQRGEFFGFLGPNGAGKSTTIKMLTGLLRPTAGRIVIAGHDLAAEPLVVKRQIGVLPEDLNLYERLTAPEFLVFAAQMYGLSVAEGRHRAEELLALMELSDAGGKMIVDFSMGMKKKIALAGALI